MEDYLIAGLILWFLANSFGMNLGPEHILTLPAILIVIFLALLFMM